MKANWNGVVPTIAYTATDGTLTSTSTLALTITAVNDTPVGSVDTASGAEDTNIAGNVLTNDTDIENDALSVTQFTVNGDLTTYTAGQTATIASKGTIQVNADGTFTGGDENQYVGNLANEGVQISAQHDVAYPAGVEAELEALKADIVSGKIVVASGYKK